jgi:C-terminal processing protease CtpA/Prc
MPKGKPAIPQEPDARRRFLQHRWRLGVYAYNSDTGVIITRVVRGTPAWKEGLEPGDVIVTVGGYQVGIVDNLVYTLGEELQLRADRNGRAPLLVQNHRNGELLMLDVRLQRFGVMWPQ